MAGFLAFCLTDALPALRLRAAVGPFPGSKQASNHFLTGLRRGILRPCGSPAGGQIPTPGSRAGLCRPVGPGIPSGTPYVNLGFPTLAGGYLAATLALIRHG